MSNLIKPDSYRKTSSNIIKAVPTGGYGSLSTYNSNNDTKAPPEPKNIFFKAVASSSLPYVNKPEVYDLTELKKNIEATRQDHKAYFDYVNSPEYQLQKTVERENKRAKVRNTDDLLRNYLLQEIKKNDVSKYEDDLKRRTGYDTALYKSINDDILRNLEQQLANQTPPRGLPEQKQLPEPEASKELSQAEKDLLLQQELLNTQRENEEARHKAVEEAKAKKEEVKPDETYKKKIENMILKDLQKEAKRLNVTTSQMIGPKKKKKFNVAELKRKLIENNDIYNEPVRTGGPKKKEK
jgi:hypothetical protein